MTTVTPCPHRVPACPGHTVRGRVPVSHPIDTGHGHAPHRHPNPPPTVSPCPTPGGHPRNEDHQATMTTPKSRAVSSASPSWQSRQVSMWPKRDQSVRPGVRPEAVSAWRSLGASVAIQTSPLPCQVDRAPFFGTTLAEVHTAQEACDGCPVQRECLAFAAANGERHGVWGGREFGREDRLRHTKEQQSAHTQHTQPPSPLVSASSLDTQTGATND